MSVEIKKFENSSQEGFFELLQIYEKYFDGELKTEVEEIVYWIDNKSPDRELLIFGAYLESKPVGYFQASYYNKIHFASVDYIAVESEHRNMALLILGFKFILEYFKSNYRNITYFAAEVLKEKKSVIRLFKKIGFKVVDANYIHPSLLPENPEHISMDIRFLLYAFESIDSIIPKQKFLTLVKTIFDYNFIQWNSPFYNGIVIENYKKSIKDILEIIEYDLSKVEYIKLS